jgi:hypothetical protein
MMRFANTLYAIYGGLRGIIPLIGQEVIIKYYLTQKGAIITPLNPHMVYNRIFKRSLC